MTGHNNEQHPNPLLALRPNDHVQGPANAPITLMEYGDFQCPHCGQAYYIIRDLQTQIGSNMKLVFREFPLTTIHSRAQDAAETAETAGAQGKFWEMHDMLFEHQESLEPEDLVSYARSLRLDSDRFTEELVSHTHSSKVKGDFMSGVRSGVNGTPTFFINGVRHDAAFDYNTLFRAISARLARLAA